MRTQVTKKGVTLYLSPEQQKFNSKKVVLIKEVKVSGLLPELLKVGRTFDVAPLYSTHLETGISSDGNEVSVLLSGSLKSGNTSCWLPAGTWAII
jgi:hypothetical protein